VRTAATNYCQFTFVDSLFGSRDTRLRPRTGLGLSMKRLIRPVSLVSGMGALLALAAASCGSEVLQLSPASGGSAGVAGAGLAGVIETGGSLASSGSSNGGAPAEGGAPDSAAGQAGAAPNDAIELGNACTTDQDCGNTGLICVRANHDFSVGVGAPPGGVCTAQCKADAECKKLGAGAVCAALSEAPLDLDVATDPTEARFCMQGCALGAPAGFSKCHGRDSFACRPFAPPNAQRCATKAPFCTDGGVCFRGYCRELGCGPRCDSDAACDAGRHCDPSSGLCVQEAVTPTPIGMPCDPDAATTPCESGRCLVLFDEKNVKTGSFCTQSCTIGEACGNGQGACELPRFADYEVGDIGYCQPTCACNADCKVSGDGCISWGDADLASYFSSAGTCEHLSAPAPETIACTGEGGSAGAP